MCCDGKGQTQMFSLRGLETLKFRLLKERGHAGPRGKRGHRAEHGPAWPKPHRGAVSQARPGWRWVPTGPLRAGGQSGHPAGHGQCSGPGHRVDHAPEQGGGKRGGLQSRARNHSGVKRKRSGSGDALRSQIRRGLASWSLQASVKQSHAQYSFQL